MVKTDFIWFSLTFVLQVVGKFERDYNFDNRYVQHFSAHEISSTAFPEVCALRIHCHVNSSCLSFVHNRHDGKCLLFSRIFLSQLRDVTQTGNVMFRKIDEESICAVPPVTIPKGRLLYVDGQKKGSTAQFMCDDFHFPTVVAGICEGGAWTQLDDLCANMAHPTYRFLTVGRVSPGRCVFLPAITPTETGLVEIVLIKDKRNVAMSMNFDGGKRVIVRNSRINGVWGTEEQETPIWPLEKVLNINLTICTEESQFRMFADSVEVFTFAHRLPSTDVAEINVNGFTLKGIFFTE